MYIYIYECLPTIQYGKSKIYAIAQRNVVSGLNRSIHVPGIESITGELHV